MDIWHSLILYSPEIAPIPQIKGILIGTIKDPYISYGNIDSSTLRIKLITHPNFWKDVMLPLLNAVAPVTCLGIEDVEDKQIRVTFKVEY